MNYQAIIQENEVRRKNLEAANHYNPYTGEGSISIPRRKVVLPDAPLPEMREMWLPEDMFDLNFVSDLVECGSLVSFIANKLKQPVNDEHINGIFRILTNYRLDYDAEFYFATCCLVTPKKTADNIDQPLDDVPFILNRAQRNYLKELEDDRRAKRPIRIILVKARQWGGSTLTQLYMMWRQLRHEKNLNSIIAAQDLATATLIRGMYDRAIGAYSMYVGDDYSLSPFGRMGKILQIRQRGCRITIGSSERPDSLRGENLCMAHFSEVTSWASTPKKKPEDLLQNIASGINLVHGTMIVLESTAKGVGNFFHREYLRAIGGKSAYKAVFMSCFDVDMYSIPIDDYEAFIRSMTDDEWYSWKTCGATLEQINWYRAKSLETSDKWRMASEFPRYALEAFQSTGRRVFNKTHVDRMRRVNTDPIWVGDVVADATHGENSLKNIRLEENSNGDLFVWLMPDATVNVKRRYLVIVDVGGRSEKSDWSVISVYDRYYLMEGGVPELAARWRGHIDHDLLIWKAAQIAEIYSHALLAPESNTPESEKTEGDHGEFIFDEVASVYDNLYCRTSAQQIRLGRPNKWGWNTNKASKQLAIDKLIWAYREDGFINYDARGCDEADTYEVKENGSLGAVEGCHDDILISDGIGIFICYDFQNFPMPVIVVIKKNTTTAPGRTRGAADF